LCEGFTYLAFELQGKDKPFARSEKHKRMEAEMKRYGLALTTLATLLVTGVTLQAAGWFCPRSPRPHLPHSTSRQAAVKDDDHLLIPEYYRQGGPRHWRDCLGQN
jgi:hypothetical protein